MNLNIRDLRFINSRLCLVLQIFVRMHHSPFVTGFFCELNQTQAETFTTYIILYDMTPGPPPP